uniref:Olfactomedin-like domain-containing protein n=1 Tax=Rhabditophanes sp. KR3021 TaxID=114890 RepID=A0AC35TWK8_9BILA
MKVFSFILSSLAILGLSSLATPRPSLHESGNELYITSPQTVPKPLSLPTIGRAQKWAMIRASGQDPMSRPHRNRPRHRTISTANGEPYPLNSAVKKGDGQKIGKVKRSIDNKYDPNTPWRRNFVLPKAKKARNFRKLKPLITAGLHQCPSSLDAVAKSKDNVTYVFSGQYVYPVWRENGLPQKEAYLISSLFHNGPRSVTAAVTNTRSGAVILFERNIVYKYQFNQQAKRFLLSKRFPRTLTSNVTFVPEYALQWMDGNVVLFNKDVFSTYDIYWNLSTFTSKSFAYFPGLPRDVIGVIHKSKDMMMLYTKSNKIAIYDTTTYSILDEFPLQINKYIACL